MSDIIHLLPDSVANQIAAGEVIQRPASVVKELLENAIDAGADHIKLILKEAGKTLVQVIDNGKGMSETDARMSFERHATSKINTSDDLFNIRTKGFRGEALASIASIAQVELKTMQCDEEVGTCIKIEGSQIISQEPASCPMGSNFAIRNLFFNVPARRKFLKKNATEFKHILNEFTRVALSHPEVELELIHQDNPVYNLSQGNSKQRIVQLFGKQINQNLVRLETATPIISISGYVGKPEFARKTTGEQFFVINQRYMRHPYFHRAVMKAYEGLIPSDCYPAYFLFMEADPATIDINIHPTKTEIKFENEQAIFRILNAAVREAIGKSNLGPSIDFDTHGVVDIPVLQRDTEIKQPQIEINPDFNPFENEHDNSPKRSFSSSTYTPKEKVPDNWQELYTISQTEKQQQLDGFAGNTEHSGSISREQNNGYFQVKNHFIATNVKSGLLLVDQKRAHERILYEKLLADIENDSAVSQNSLYPVKIQLSLIDYSYIKELQDDLEKCGIQISDLGSNCISVQSMPDFLANESPEKLLETFLELMKQDQHFEVETVTGKLAASLATASAIPYGKLLHVDEMRDIVDKLFSCENPDYSPKGHKILKIISVKELEQLLG